jgi:hypothetical protein
MSDQGFGRKGHTSCNVCKEKSFVSVNFWWLHVFLTCGHMVLISAFMATWLSLLSCLPFSPENTCDWNQGPPNPGWSHLQILKVIISAKTFLQTRSRLQIAESREVGSTELTAGLHFLP